MNKTFNSFGLPESLVHSLEKAGFVTPTAIQEQTIPVALDAKDIMGSAQTGTGKTAAFGIPLISHLMNNEQATALVVTPTRELAAQVVESLDKLLPRDAGISSALLIGGQSMYLQLRQLKQKPRLVVGTPGRITDHLKRGTLKTRSTDFFVLDETDRMLDMGFSIQIDDIVKYLPEERQTLLFSATFPKNIERMAHDYMKDPIRVSVGKESTPAANVKQELLYVTDSEKYDNLLEQLDQREGSVIVFVKTKVNAEKIALKLRKEKHRADALHGGLQHRKRERVTEAFRRKRHRIMVATDIAARGLDIPHIEHVINYNLPQCPEDYIHRIGRTARAGAEGAALCLISPSEKRKWQAIDEMLNPEKKKKSSRRNDDNRRGRSGFSRSKSRSRFSKDSDSKKRFGSKKGRFSSDKETRFKKDDETSSRRGKFGSFKGNKSRNSFGESFSRKDRSGSFRDGNSQEFSSKKRGRFGSFKENNFKDNNESSFRKERRFDSFKDRGNSEESSKRKRFGSFKDRPSKGGSDFSKKRSKFSSFKKKETVKRDTARPSR